ncbi:hypothetical protein Q1695_004487 [Nippostrongylus brasiliensis]|nr:hypothetical protein Q1695_004487 [Nippostrongylus brasiliensis]
MMVPSQSGTFVRGTRTSNAHYQHDNDLKPPKNAFFIAHVLPLIEQCVCAIPREVINEFVKFNREALQNIEWNRNLSTKAKEELANPGTHTTGKPTLIFITLSELVSGNDTIYDQVHTVLQSQFNRKVNELKSTNPSRFGCNGKLDYFNGHEKNLTIGCLYKLTVNKEKSEQNN